MSDQSGHKSVLWNDQANGTTLMIRSVNVMGRSGNKVRSVGHKSVLWNDQANGTTLMIRSVRVNGHSG